MGFEVDTLRSVVALAYENKIKGYRVIGRDRNFDVSVSELRKAGVVITGVTHKLALYAINDTLATQSEIDGRTYVSEIDSNTELEVYSLLSQYAGTRYEDKGVPRISVVALKDYLAGIMGVNLEIRAVGMYSYDESQDREGALAICEPFCTMDYIGIDDSGGMYPYDSEDKPVDKGLVCLIDKDCMDRFGALEYKGERITVETPDTNYPVITEDIFLRIAQTVQA